MSPEPPIGWPVNSVRIGDWEAAQTMQAEGDHSAGFAHAVTRARPSKRGLQPRTNSVPTVGLPAEGVARHT